MSMYPIASSTLSSANIDITNIPATFSHLQLRLISRGTGNQPTTAYSATGYLTFNGDGNANYAAHYLGGSGASAFGGNYATNYNNITLSDLGGPYSGQLASVYTSAIIDIFDYANTNKYKTVKAFYGADMNGYGRVFLSSGLWMSTAAINRIQISNDGGTFAAGSRWDLYGVTSSGMTGA